MNRVISVFLLCVSLCSAEETRPITLSAHTGVFTMRGRDLNSSDTFGTVGLELHAQLKPWLGYDLSFDLATGRIAGPDETLRLFSGGLTFQKRMGRAEGRYRLAYGVVSGRGARQLLAHGPQLVLRPNTRLPLKLSVTHVIENDWIQTLDYPEYYKSFLIGLGTGVHF